ncbi:hypothetical protein [Aliihoeflea aestuarii]|jgi:hypothetical protein|uniref:hypothetical protein n=1 Tax=Aliihoeflea aestuarii TaxID=453840 RepID=UPI002092A9CF|nr:hypothetical protein [Aliihoeflea aestuarii]
MKPRKVTAESEMEERRRATCDLILTRAAQLMVDEAEAPVGMVLDRLLTYAAAQACTIDGSPTTARNFRLLADRIEAGIFHSLTGEDRVAGSRH